MLIYFRSDTGTENFLLVNDEKYTLDLKSQIIEETSNLRDYFPETSGLNKEINSLLENPYPMSENFVIGDQFLWSSYLIEKNNYKPKGHIIKFNIELVSKSVRYSEVWHEATGILFIPIKLIDTNILESLRHFNLWPGRRYCSSDGFIGHTHMHWKNLEYWLYKQNCIGDCDDPIDGTDISKCTGPDLGYHAKYITLDA